MVEKKNTHAQNTADFIDRFEISKIDRENVFR